jgi:RimJ/RimL family protein N-acetyltransferase
MKLGLKLFSTNTGLIPAAQKLRKEKIYDYIELYVVPGSFNSVFKAWTALDIPFIIHAPHSYSGLNMSIRECEDSNRVLIEEVELFRSQLNPLKVIFHSGINGSVDETIRQIILFKKMFSDLFNSGVIENKPKIGINGEVCIGTSPDEIAFIKKETDIGFCLDIGHAVYYAASANLPYPFVIERFLELKPKMYHISDGIVSSERDSHLNFGDGNLDLSRIIKKIPNDAYVTIETEKDLSLELSDFERDAGYFTNICKNKTETARMELRIAAPEDVMDLFLWRSNPDVQKNSFNSKPLLLHEHERWFENRLQDQKTSIYIAVSDNKKIGTIRFEEKSDFIKVSVMLNPEYFGRGFGADLIRLGTEKYADKKNPDKPLIAEIKTDNTASIKAFKKAGYEESHISCMMHNRKS